MPQHERGLYEPGDDGRVYDASEDDEDVEGSRLPLLIVLALLVLAMFAGRAEKYNYCWNILPELGRRECGVVGFLQFENGKVFRLLENGRVVLCQNLLAAAQYRQEKE